MLNLSNKELHNDAVCAQGYTLSFLCNKQLVGASVAKAFCNLEKHSNKTSDEFSFCIGIVYSSISSSSLPDFPVRFTRGLKILNRDNDFHITKVDKSNAIVMMNKEDYIFKN